MLIKELPSLISNNIIIVYIKNIKQIYNSISMLLAKQNKVDLSKLSEEEKKLFRMYGKLPTGKDILSHKLKERKYFDTEDFSLSKAGNSDFSKDYQLLQKKCSELNSENYSFQTTNDNLQKESDDLQRQIREKDKLINAGATTLQTTQSQLTTSQNQNQQKDIQITQLNNDLTTTRNQAGQLNTQITQITNEKDQIIKGLKSEITEKDKEIISLKAQLGVLSPEEVLKNKISLKKRELNGIVRGLSLNRQTVVSLCDAYEKLGLARLNYNQENITNAKNDIKNIEEEFFSATDDNDKLYEVYQNCEQIAK